MVTVKKEGSYTIKEDDQGLFVLFFGQKRIGSFQTLLNTERYMKVHSLANEEKLKGVLSEYSE